MTHQRHRETEPRQIDPEILPIIERAINEALTKTPDPLACHRANIALLHAKLPDLDDEECDRAERSIANLQRQIDARQAKAAPIHHPELETTP